MNTQGATQIVATWTVAGQPNTRVFRTDKSEEMAYLAGVRDALRTAGVTLEEVTLEVAA